MDIPNLPTDNLYKFIALSGVFIFIVLFVSMILSMSRISDEATELETEIGEIRFQVSILEDKVQFNRSERIRLDSITNRRYGLDSIINPKIDLDKLYAKFHSKEQREYFQFIYNNRNNIVPELKGYEKLLDGRIEFDKLYDEISLKNHQVSRKKVLLKEKLNRLLWSFIFYFIGIILSFGLSSYGFVLWYFRGQRFLDIKLKAEIIALDKSKES